MCNLSITETTGKKKTKNQNSVCNCLLNQEIYREKPKRTYNQTKKSRAQKASKKKETNTYISLNEIDEITLRAEN